MYRLFNNALVAIVITLIGTACSLAPYSMVKGEDKAPNIVLNLDTGGHTAGIRKLIVREDKTELITTGSDKTIRVWDVKTGKEKRKILGEVGTGNWGEIKAIALSNNYLAVGGKFSGEIGLVKIYDYKSGEILFTLNQEKYPTSSLAFSKDGKYLMSGTWGQDVNIWNVNNDFKLHDTLHQYGIIDVCKFIQKTGKTFAVIATDYSTTMELYDVENRETREYISLDHHLSYLDSTDARSGEIAISSYDESKIWIYDYNLELKQIIENATLTGGLKYSPDGKLLIVGSVDNPTEVNIYNASKKYKKQTTFKKHNNLVEAVGFLDNRTAISSGGNNYEIYIWDIYTKKIKTTIAGIGDAIWKVGVSGNNIAWGKIPVTYKKPYPPLQKSINLKTFKISNNIENFKKISSVNGSYLLHSPAKLGYTWSILEVKKNNKVISEIGNGIPIQKFGWYKDFIIIANKGIYIYDIDGNLVTKLLGHKSDVWSLALDGDRLVSGGSDQTIKIWDLSQVGKFGTIKPIVSIFIAKDDSWVMWTPEGYFTQNADRAKSVYFHINNGHDKKATDISINKLYDHFFRPDLVQLKLQGFDIDQYTNGLTYEDVLKDPPPSIAIAKIGKNDIDKKKRTLKLSFNVQQTYNGGVGVIRIYQEGKLVKTIGEGEIKREIANADEKIEEEKLNEHSKRKQAQYLAQKELSSKSVNTLDTSYIIGEVKLQRIINKTGTYSITLPIRAGKNSISIEAFNKTNTVASYRQNVEVKVKIKKRKPIIYVIAAGVNEFEQDNVSQLKYSENDAKTIAKEIKNATESKTEVTLLTGKKVTKENILKAIKHVKKKAHLEDKMFFYISTHGKAARGRLYLVPQNNKKLKNWINFEEVFKEIQAVSALDQIFIIDACESGQASDIMSSVYDAKASVLAKQSGVHLLMATTKGTAAFESSDKNVKHGVFTNNILKALNSKATDKNHNKKISIIELSKTLYEPEYSADHQFPIIRNVGEDTYIKKIK